MNIRQCNKKRAKRISNPPLLAAVKARFKKAAKAARVMQRLVNYQIQMDYKIFSGRQYGKTFLAQTVAYGDWWNLAKNCLFPFLLPQIEYCITCDKLDCRAKQLAAYAKILPPTAFKSGKRV